jgi:hypothetical protein
MSSASLAAIGLVAGLLVGMNPVLISAFTTFISSFIGRKASNTKYTLAGVLFIAYFVLFILFFSVGFASFVIYLSPEYRQSIALSISLLSIIVGVVLIRRYFYSEPLITPPQDVTEALHSLTTKKTGILNIIALTMVVTYATLPTIGIVIAIMAVMGSLLGPSSLVWSIPFIVGLITPIYIILAMLSNKTKPSAILAWKEKSKPVMRLYNGLTIVALAWLLLFFIAGGEII